MRPLVPSISAGVALGRGPDDLHGIDDAELEKPIDVRQELGHLAHAVSVLAPWRCRPPVGSRAHDHPVQERGRAGACSTHSKRKPSGHRTIAFADLAQDGAVPLSELSTRRTTWPSATESIGVETWKRGADVAAPQADGFPGVTVYQTIGHLTAATRRLRRPCFKATCARGPTHPEVVRRSVVQDHN